MQVARTVAEVRTWVAQARKAGKRIGLVPTMGALHVGHASLIDAATARCDFVVVTIFVNPTQFGPGEDLETYPRPFEEDAALCLQHGVDVIFAPSPEEMYPLENVTWVTVEKLTDPLCGRSRPGHFRGVTTVCTKLFNIVMPDIAFFGQKDAQQALVIRRMVADLNQPLEIVVCPTVRESDGLAVSSRNRYLDEQQRRDATVLYRALQACQEMIEAGQRNADEIRGAMIGVLREVPALKVEYVSLADAESLEEPVQLQGQILVAIAAHLGPARLIDNFLLDVPDQ